MPPTIFPIVIPVICVDPAFDGFGAATTPVAAEGDGLAAVADVKFGVASVVTATLMSAPVLVLEVDRFLGPPMLTLPPPIPAPVIPRPTPGC